MKKDIKGQYRRYYLCMNPFDKDRYIFAKNMSSAAGIFAEKLGKIYGKNSVREIHEVEPNRFIILEYSMPQRNTSHPLAFEVREEDREEDDDKQDVCYTDSEDWEIEKEILDNLDWDEFNDPDS